MDTTKLFRIEADGMNGYFIGDAGGVRKPPTNPRALFVAWLEKHRAKYPALHSKRNYRALLLRDNTMGEMGDIWKDLKNDVLSKAGDAVKQLAVKFGDNAPQVARAAAEYKLIATNIERAKNGQPPINVSEVAGFSDIRNILLFGALGLVALKILKG